MQYVNAPNQLGKILAARRKTLRLSQSEVAAKLGISQNRLSELEDRADKLTVDRLLSLLNLLGLELSVQERSAVQDASRVEW
jgi:HTH-type transcriptional regulator/antitoxin HipB